MIEETIAESLTVTWRRARKGPCPPLSPCLVCVRGGEGGCELLSLLCEHTVGHPTPGRHPGQQKDEKESGGKRGEELSRPKGP